LTRPRPRRYAVCTEIKKWYNAMLSRHGSSSAPDDSRRQRILDAAYALLLSVGYDDATTNAIAAATHLSKATIYSWWERKEDLFAELIGRETVRLLDDWLARVEADPQGGTLRALYQHGFLALDANPVMRALYSRESQVLGSFVRRRGLAVYTPRYLASLQTVRALQDAGILRRDVPPDVVNHVFLVLQVGLIAVGEVFDPAHFPPLESVARLIADLMQSALGPQTPVDPEAAKAAIRIHFSRLRSMIVASFAAAGAPTV
jgi:AcrR family transcriptional regulator